MLAIVAAPAAKSDGEGPQRKPGLDGQDVDHLFVDFVASCVSSNVTHKSIVKLTCMQLS